jgi:hypothetical protein
MAAFSVALDIPRPVISHHLRVRCTSILFSWVPIRNIINRPTYLSIHLPIRISSAPVSFFASARALKERAFSNVIGIFLRPLPLRSSPSLPFAFRRGGARRRILFPTRKIFFRSDATRRDASVRPWARLDENSPRKTAAVVTSAQLGVVPLEHARGNTCRDSPRCEPSGSHADSFIFRDARRLIQRIVPSSR